MSTFPKSSAFHGAGTLSINSKPASMEYFAHFEKNCLLYKQKIPSLSIKHLLILCIVTQMRKGGLTKLRVYQREVQCLTFSLVVNDELIAISKNGFFNIELPQQFELDLSGNNYEKIDVVPKGSNRFVHDFYSNYTAIVDIENQLCFIMPLDRNVTLPPNNLYDLLFKMSGGYYSLDTEKIRREMRKVEPSIKNLDTFGIYIKKECEEFTTFMLEKIVSGVTKRSIQGMESYIHYAGNNQVAYFFVLFTSLSSKTI
ncbi:hypothetical protein PGB90_010153 [Kerria lacca]